MDTNIDYEILRRVQNMNSGRPSSITVLDSMMAKFGFFGGPLKEYLDFLAEEGYIKYLDSLTIEITEAGRAFLLSLSKKQKT